MKLCLVLLASGAFAIPFGDQSDVPSVQDAIQRPSKLKELVSRIKDVSGEITAAPPSQPSGDAGGPQPPPDGSVSEYIVSILESVESSLSGIIEYLGGGAEVSPGSLPPVNPPTGVPTASGPLHTMPPPSSGMPPRSSMGMNTTYTPPAPTSQGAATSEKPPFSNTTVMSTPTPFPSMNGTLQTPPPTPNTTAVSTPASSPSMNGTSQMPPPTPNTTSTAPPLSPTSTFSMQPLPTNVTIAPTGGVPTLNFTTLMPIPIPSSTSGTPPSAATSDLTAPSAFAVADQQIQSFLQWLLGFLQSQLQNAAGGNPVPSQ